ncbi:hypothetical protein GCU67_10140 [Modestobacter muralis]|uniref:LPXTG cell wall anchor domain-containing protein n=1 Tax=Modestobacter muralis TaxID=1608614 RepID=A0A6P0ETS6_9ACTN|nr:hypothetical protein [Modestobacter muralis]NEK94527.1 hypothetical protein [Modestobacter muralis]NEN51415.1 hypothetical protein [Modestobacter muralis]
MPTSYPRVLVVAVLSLVAGGVALATPAAAMEDARRPTATVTHGPSCGPDVVRALVTNGTQPHRVALVVNGGDEQASAVLAAGQQVELVSEPIGWGETVDVQVAVTAGDGTPETPLDLETYTRPSAEDCALVAAPPSATGTAPPATSAEPGPVTSAGPETTPPTTGAPGSPGVPATTGPGSSPSSDPATSAPGTTPGSTSGTTPGPTGGTPTGTPDTSAPPRTSSPGTASGPASSVPAASSSAAAVSPGGVVTVRATGFTAGEPVAVTIPGVDEPLTTVTAAADGSVETVVQIPRGAALGSTTVQFTGSDSAATAGLDLDVAARDGVVPESTGSPAAVAAGLALVGAAGTLGLMSARRSRGRHADADR